MKHIYFFDEDCNASQYGVGTYIKTLVNLLIEEEIKITVVNIQSIIEKIDVYFVEKVRYIEIPILRNRNESKESYYRNVFYLLFPFIDRNENNIAHINYRNCIDLVRRLKFKSNFKIVLSWHFSLWSDLIEEIQLKEIMRKHDDGFNLEKKENAILDVVELEKDLINNYCDVVVVLTKCTLMSIQSIYKIDAYKVRLIQNGLYDFNFVADKNILKKEFKISLTEKILLFVGRLDDNKNLPFLIKVFYNVLLKDEDVRLIVVGSGNFITPLLYAYPNYSNITFTGFLNKEELHKFYLIADIGVIPSRYEEFGYVAVEMMMHGLPVIANNSGGLSEIIENDISGKLLNLFNGKNEEESVDILSDSILDLLKNESEMSRLGRNARKRYLKCFEIMNYREKMLKVYNEL
ncbi:glycosyltransferase [Macellibacteroides fermentans]|uniref:glycosyltransferase n=1 Tax=Macellibacteroides fermentans TaxID=879969 RepID=UPI00406C9C6B